MPDKNIVLYRYHKDVEYCKKHLNHLIRLNPHLEVHGIYGGKEEDYNYYTENLPQLKTNYLISDVPAEWKWKNFDFILQKWYKEKGNKIEFTRFYVYEWDLLFTLPIGTLYGQLPEDAVVFSGLIKLKKVQNYWYWSSYKERKTEFERLTQYLSEQYNFIKDLYACLCPGFSATKAFLEEMCQISLPDLSNDEVRLPMYCQLANYTAYNSHFLDRWFSFKEYFKFNCNRTLVKKELIFKDLNNKKGKRAFHPFQELNNKEIYTLLMENNFQTTKKWGSTRKESELLKAFTLYKLYRFIKQILGR